MRKIWPEQVEGVGFSRSNSIYTESSPTLSRISIASLATQYNPYNSELRYGNTPLEGLDAQLQMLE